MRYFYTAPNLSQPSFETLQEYSALRFKKLERFLRGFKESELNLKIHMRKERNEFHMVVELYLSSIKKDIVIKERDYDLRKAIDKASQNLTNEIIRHKKKRQTLARERRLSRKSLGVKSADE